MDLLATMTDADYATLASLMSSISTVSLIVKIIGIVAMWRIFSKAGEEGWKAIIPIYNTYIRVKLINGNGWLMFLFLIPIVGTIYAIILDFKMAKAFGYGIGFGFGLLFLKDIFQLILAFDKSQYQGPQ